MSETETLNKLLTEAKTEIESLRLRLDNVTFLLRKEMTEGGKLCPVGRKTTIPFQIKTLS